MSFAQPIRRVFGTIVFRAREHAEMPPPGDTRPARLTVELHDLIWEAIVTIAVGIGFAADRLNRLQFFDHPPILDAGVLHARRSAVGTRRMVLIRDLATQGAQTTSGASFARGTRFPSGRATLRAKPPKATKQR